MKLAAPFFRLPISFDADRLLVEAEALCDDFCPHPQGFPGSDAVPLITPYGRDGDDSLVGPMGATKALKKSPYIQQVMAAFSTPLGRSRIMRLEEQAQVQAHRDTSYYWFRRLRLHIPIVTSPGVELFCGEARVHMKAGECWTLSNADLHGVDNPTGTVRMHLVIDTVGSPRVWNWIREGTRVREPPVREIGFDPKLTPALRFEQVNYPRVMSPGELEGILRGIIEELYAEPKNDGQLIATLVEIVEGLRRLWLCHWAQVGDRTTEPYERLCREVAVPLAALAKRLTCADSGCAVQRIRDLVLLPAVNPKLPPGLPDSSHTLGTPHGSNEVAFLEPRVQLISDPRAQVVNSNRASSRAAFDRPVFIVSPPRSGSTLLFETLAQSPSLWSIGRESHDVFEGIGRLHPASHGWESNRLDASAASEEVVLALTTRFASRLRDRSGAVPRAAQGLRLLEKTPKNSLRVPFLKAAFPDARFVFLYRPPRPAMSSMFEAWQSRKFVTYPRLPGWKHELSWSLLLTPGWQELTDAPLGRVVARQWQACIQQLLDDLLELPPTDWAVADYEALIQNPQKEISRLCRFLDVEWDTTLSAPLPISRHTVSQPDPSKWKRNWEAIEPEAESVLQQVERVQALFSRREQTDTSFRPPEEHLEAERQCRAAARSAQEVALSAGRRSVPHTSVGRKEEGHRLRSVHTPSMVEMLQRARASLVISTYQTGSVILASVRDGAIHTHFTSVPKPMGLAYDGVTLTVGGRTALFEFRNQPALAHRLPDGNFDGCLVSSATTVTGDIAVHELAYGSAGVWAVNTRFSCLCTFDQHHSFVPRWRPRFVEKLSPDDRCHLNGLAMVDGQPKVVSALGTSAEVPAAWRPNKATGGCLIDVDSGEFLARGLCMPHSPRYHDGKLYVLESGKGVLGVVDEQSGRVEEVGRVPGFARGLALIGDVAFVGLSQVREKIFDGIPLGHTLTDRASGVWVLHLGSGETLGFLRFDGTVFEVFDVQLLPGIMHPTLLDWSDPLQDNAFVIPDEALPDVRVGKTAPA